MAGNDFGDFGQPRLELAKHRLVVAAHHQVDERGDAVAQLFGTQHGAVGAYQPDAFQPLQAPPAGRGGEADVLGQVRDRQSGVFLQRGQQQAVGAVEFG